MLSHEVSERVSIMRLENGARLSSWSQPDTPESDFQWFCLPLMLLEIRVVFPLIGPAKALGRGWKSPKNGEKLQNYLPWSDREDREKLQTISQNCIFGVIFPFWGAGGNFPHFRASDVGGKCCILSAFFGDFRPGGFPSPPRGKQLAILELTLQTSNVSAVCDTQPTPLFSFP